MSIKIKPLSRDDVMAYYGDSFPYTVRGYVAMRGDERLGIAGVTYSRPVQCFSQISDELKQHPRLVVQGVRMIRGLLAEIEVPVVALVNECESSAEGFLRHVGFESTSQKGVYQWVQ